MQLPIVEQTLEQEQGILLQLRILSELKCFQGHFPGTPILPGVVMLNWAEALGRRYLAVQGEFDSVQNLKFQQVIKPGSQVMADLKYEPDKAMLYFSFTSSVGRHASGRMKFKL